MTSIRHPFAHLRPVGHFQSNALVVVKDCEFHIRHLYLAALLNFASA
jgi:hypothetical protein